jgi:sialate O-acetylesterase
MDASSRNNLKMKKALSLTTVFTCITFMCFAQTKLPLFFSDSMVLQQKTDAAIWGTDIANKKITVVGSWGKSSTTTTDNSGRWKLKLTTPAAGGPYTVTVKGSTEIILKEVLIGEVWLCAGQSNMEMPMKGYMSKPPQPVDSSEYFIANSLNPKLRVFKPGWNPPSRTTAYDVISGKWVSASPATTPDFSATAYFFARKLQLELNIPIAIIVVARGGSSIESWMDSSTLATVKPVVIPSVLEWKLAHNTPTMMYNTFLHPFIGYTIKGVTWSQGEANRKNNNEYLELFTKMIGLWRSNWQQGEFPFYFAQLAPRGSSDNLIVALFREAQLNTMLTVKSTGMASILDIGSKVQEHYPQKKVIGDRLAQWALVKNYGKAGVASGPIVKEITTTNDHLKLTFNYCGLGLTSFDKPLTDFEIAGADEVYQPATATITDNNTSIIVTNTNVKNPMYVRYCFKNAVEASLFNKDGLPAPSFRGKAL